MGSAQKPFRDPLEFRPKSPDASKSGSAPEPEQIPPEDDALAYHELRQLILAPEQQALEQLHQRIDDPESRTEDVSTVVAEAIQRRRKQGGDEALSNALAPTIETALRESVRNDPTTLADALFPVMGPAIRRSILETLRSFLESFNQVLDQSLSPRGLGWRIEALRTGRSFTEVALLHSLVFRVEQVFLIHKKTGLSLGHVSAPAVAMQDPSLVSGMLSAIQDFVRDSFHTTQGQGINRMDVGDLDVWIEQGPFALIACVIRGVAPRDLRDRMAEVLENIHREYAAELDRFTGDSAPFAKVGAELSRCLELRYKEEAKSKGLGLAYAATAAIVLLLAGWFGFRWYQYHRWEQLANTLRDQPGYVITSFGRENGKFAFHGMRDPLAQPVSTFVSQANLDPAKADFRWGAYYALDDAIVEQRARTLLQPPESAKLSVSSGTLHVAGTAPLEWLRSVSGKAMLIPGIRSIDFAPGLDPDQAAFDQERNSIDAALVRFPLASASLPNSESAALRRLAQSIQEMLRYAQARQQAVSIEVIGHTDSTGAETTNRDLSQRRADRLMSELVRIGIPASCLHAQGVGTAQPVRQESNEENRQFNRSATLRVSLSNH